jgi:RNA polymerase sigma-70 factor (sigma-E family)
MRRASAAERTFDEFIMARRRVLLGYAYSLAGGDRHAAEDLLQEALVKTWLAWPRIRDGAPDAYARRILIRSAARAAKRCWRGERPTTDLPDLGESTDPAGAVDERLRLAAALRHLPPRQRTAVVLRHYCDLSEGQVAENLDCAQGTVSSLTSRGVSALRSLVAPAVSGVGA